MSILKIAIGIVLGLLCWNLFIGYLERWDRIEQQKQAEKNWAEFDEQCKSGKLDQKLA